jgi:cell division protein FtsZ
MREAFERADNVLATAAKCITDVINSTGQINVDFADVCTVMRKWRCSYTGKCSSGRREQGTKGYRRSDEFTFAE